MNQPPSTDSSSNEVLPPQLPLTHLYEVTLDNLDSLRAFRGGYNLIHATAKLKRWGEGLLDDQGDLDHVLCSNISDLNKSLRDDITRILINVLAILGKLSPYFIA